MLHWVQEHKVMLAWLTAASVVLFVASLVVVPLLIVRLPPDYFKRPRRSQGPWAHRHPALRVALKVGKNILGWVFILAGIAMLVLPGQGLLSILLGVLLVDIPGKYRLERWLVSRPRVAGAMNWLRKKAGRPPLEAGHAAA